MIYKRRIKRIIISFCWPLINIVRKRKLRNCKELFLNLGCSSVKIDNFINIDIRHTNATYVTMNLTKPKIKEGSIKLAFSNAFFEHLYKDERTTHLLQIRKLLQENGAICYIGIPYFKNIAKFYLEKEKGTAGPVFDLYNVYRYTHGNPDMRLSEGWYLGQLHKSLFDESEITQLLREANFNSFAIFSYSYPDDKNLMPVNIGFYATKENKGESILTKEAFSFLKQFDNRFLVYDSLKLIN